MISPDPLSLIVQDLQNELTGIRTAPLVRLNFSLAGGTGFLSDIGSNHA